MRLLAAVCSVVLALSSRAPGQEVEWKEGSTAPLLQLTGELFQLHFNGIYFKCPTNSQTLSNYGVFGVDLGIPVSFADKTVLLFGDTLSCAEKRDGDKLHFNPTDHWGKGDCIGFFEKPDFSRCNFIPDLEKRLAAGEKTPKADYANCPRLQIFKNKTAEPARPIFWETAISGLAKGQDLGTFDVPTGGFALKDHLYVFYNVHHQGKVGEPVFMLDCVLARSDHPSSEWKEGAPPTLTKLCDFSTHPDLANTSEPPSEAESGGKFIHVAAVVLEQAAIGAELRAGLPEALQKAETLVFLLGSSWHYRHSNLYLAVAAGADLEALKPKGAKDESKFWYCTGLDKGQPTWGHQEHLAAPLIQNWSAVGPSFGEHSAVWNEKLGRFLLAYQEKPGHLQIRLAATPWGPWPDPVTVLKRENLKTLIHFAKDDPITLNHAPLFKKDGEPFTQDNAQLGSMYGPYLFQESNLAEDGTVSVYFTLSTWNPYEVFLVKTSFSAPARK